MLTAILTAIVGYVVLRSAIRHRKANIAIMRLYRFRHVLTAVAVTGLIAGTIWGLYRVSPVFTKNPVLWLASVIFHTGNGNGIGNLVLFGIQWKWYAVVFLPVLALALPRFAQLEETQYRDGTRNWLHGIARSTLFGLAHMIMMISLGACIGLIWAGLLFTWAYFRGGVVSSTTYHAAFNTVVITVLLVTILVS